MSKFAAKSSGIPAADQQKAKTIIEKIARSYSAKVVGQESLRTSMLVAVIANGHIMLESVPGLAKTLAAKTLAESVQAVFHRIQCTPDLLPSDIVGTQIYDASTGSFSTQLGPVHANFVLLDEINRSSAKTQSAMLEAMQERQTTIGGVEYKLPKPFLVMATQNPIEQEGTYELPEAQLDRFLIKEIVDYPTPADELEVLARLDSGVFDQEGSEGTLASLEDLLFLQQTAKKVYIDQTIRNYIVSLIYVTRNPKEYLGEKMASYIEYGASPRGTIAFVQASRALALLNGRDYVIPEDIKQLRHQILRHRVILNYEADADNVRNDEVVDAIVNSIPSP
ncbi:MAG: MoxR family ATPase [Microbacteriaceae bacterium]